MNDKSCGIVPFTENGGVRKYLLIEQTGGYWAFPKGHPNDGETDEQAALRELAEETGVTGCAIVSGFEFRQNYTHTKPGYPVHKEVVFFLGLVRSPSKSEANDEVASSEWLSFDEAKKRLTFKESVEMLGAAEDFLSKKASR